LEYLEIWFVATSSLNLVQIESEAHIKGLFNIFPNARTVQQMMETMERIMEDPLAYNNNNNWSTTSSRDDVGGYRRGRTP
ncbi:hypothetical protein FRX31_004949, partial [Thalictrum thalictroides]